MGLKISRKKGADEDVLLEIAEATTSKAGLLSAGDKKKLDGIKTGAEVNQNAFGKVVVDEVTISASTEVDTLTLAAGNNVTLTADQKSKKLTIASKNTTYTAASAAPKAAGTASVGTSAKYAREDHVHPAQTSVSGNAGSATKLATARTIALSGDVTGSASFNGTANVSIAAKLKNAGVQVSASARGLRSPPIPIIRCLPISLAPVVCRSFSTGCCASEEPMLIPAPTKKWELPGSLPPPFNSIKI